VKKLGHAKKGDWSRRSPKGSPGASQGGCLFVQWIQRTFHRWCEGRGIGLIRNNPGGLVCLNREKKCRVSPLRRMRGRGTTSPTCQSDKNRGIVLKTYTINRGRILSGHQEGPATLLNRIRRKRKSSKGSFLKMGGMERHSAAEKGEALNRIEEETDVPG